MDEHREEQRELDEAVREDEDDAREQETGRHYWSTDAFVVFAILDAEF